MIKKLLLGMFVLGLVAIPVMGTVYASESEVKPWEDLKQFRGGFEQSAKNSGLEKEEFFALRDATREAHRETRLAERRARLENGECLDPQEIEDRMQKRGWRFAE
ncbi:MAG: hypothetical protein WDZ85_03045 [Candidatus Paceibacterota bacterium]